MRVQLLALVAATLFCSALLAQKASPFEGKWTGTLQTAGGRGLPIEAVFDAAGGKWRIVASSKENPCMNRDLPLTITNQSAVELVFALNGSKALAGCSDATIALKLIDTKTLEGAVDDGRKVRLVKE
jgi:hypothetical protein